LNKHSFTFKFNKNIHKLRAAICTSNTNVSVK